MAKIVDSKAKSGATVSKASAKKLPTTASKLAEKTAKGGKAVAKVAKKTEEKVEAVRSFVGVTVGMCAALESAGIYHGAWEHSGGISDSQFSIAHKNMDSWLADFSKEKGKAIAGFLVITARKNLAMRCEKKGAFYRVNSVVVQRGIVSRGQWSICTAKHLETGYGVKNVRFFTSKEAALKECGNLKFPKHYGIE